MNKITVSALFRRHIKGTAGQWLTAPGERVTVGPRGFDNDCRWVVVGDENKFVAQRQSGDKGIAVRSICLVYSRMTDDSLVVSAPDMPDLALPLRTPDGAAEDVEVWRAPTARGLSEGPAAEEWWSAFLGRERPGRYRLMRMTDAGCRPSKCGDAAMGFQDSFPFLVISDATLGMLNGKLLAKDERVATTDRFRANIWLRGCGPHEEDRYARFRIGGIVFEGQTLCDRCDVICIDQ